MKKLYNKPHVTVDTACPSQMIAVSGNFIEGETTTSGIYDEKIDGNQAWTKEDNIWEEW